LVGFFGGGPADAGGFEIVQGAADAVGNAVGEEFLIIGIGLTLENAAAGGGGVRVRGGHHHVLKRQAGSLIHHLLGGIEDFARDHAAIADDEDELGSAIIEGEAAGVEFIVDVRGLAILHVAVDGDAEVRGDVAGGGSGAELTFLRSRLSDGGSDEDAEAEEQQGEVAAVHGGSLGGERENVE
jgi:hypothetical protein